MKKTTIIRWSVVTAAAMVLIVGGATAAQTRASDYVAYSMNEAARRLDQFGEVDREVAALGHMTRLIGAVYDPENSDLVLMGVIVPGESELSLEDFVVALRARLVHRRWPEVSIDKTDETPQTNLQKVRLEGGIDGTRYGKDLVDADVVLKKLALAELSGEIWGVSSYVDMAADRAKKENTERNMGTRFWFYPRKAPVVVDDGIVFTEQVYVGVRRDVYISVVAGTEEPDPEKRVNIVADTFAESVTNAYEEISLQYPEVGRVKTLLGLAGVAYGVELLKVKPPMDYWLKEFPVAHVEIPSTYPLIVKEAPVEGWGVLQVDGGVQLRAYQDTFEREGDVKALRDVVLRTRPIGKTLVWRVPIGDWSLPGMEPAQLEPSWLQAQFSAPEGNPIGCTVVEQFLPKRLSWRSPSPDIGTLPRTYHFASEALPVANHLTPNTQDSNVGGVMLATTAKVEGSKAAGLDVVSHGFSLILDGNSSQVPLEEFRRFVTALWCVYFSDGDPGISIDPIAPDVDKHLVRYIGNVLNTDLGRVMREADYMMKKWAVGTEGPGIQGFKDVEDRMVEAGVRHMFSSRRFWFVPEDMTFKQCNDALLFDSGRMRVKTEYMIQDKGVAAEPGDEAFAASFTERYNEIEKKYPIYRELFEYAKLVSLAKYLKEQSVPLFWFLMANKDQVLTEDSPGTVDALAKGSKYFEGVTVMGGVDLATKGRYVMDETAAQAIQQAMANTSGHAASATSAFEHKNPMLSAVEPASFKVNDRDYSVVPQHSLTSGKDRHGLRYQTDLALRENGQPGLELVRYFRPGDRSGGEFGQGWHLLIPYRIQPVGNAKRNFLNAVIPTKMAAVNLLNETEEVLTFSDDHYSIAGYVPDTLESSQVIGLFLMSDASYRLADKLGNQFAFDPAGFMTDMVLADSRHVHVEYLSGPTDRFSTAPYELRQEGSEKVTFLNARLPNMLRVVDRVHESSEVLVFSDSSDGGQYVPQENTGGPFTSVAVLTDGSFCLLDHLGNRSFLDSSGRFVRMAVAQEDGPFVSSLVSGENEVTFTYTVDRTGRVVIASSSITPSKDGEEKRAVVHYEYDAEGRLVKTSSRDAKMASAHELGSRADMLTRSRAPGRLGEGSEFQNGLSGFE